MTQKRILIVEDDLTIAETLAYNLTHEGYDIRTTDNGHDAIDLVRSFRPDLVLLDVMLPGMSGFEVCQRLRADPLTAKTPIMILTVRSSETDVVYGLDLGAQDYVTKPFSPKVLLARIRSLLRRDKDEVEALPAKIAYHGLAIDTEKREMVLNGRVLNFSKTEFDILALLCSRPGKVFSRQNILDRCWPRGVRVVDRSVDVHINAIRRKLGARLRPCVETIRGIGYRMKE